MQRAALEGHYLRRFLFPVRIVIMALDQMIAHFLQPFRLDFSHAACI